MKPDERNRMTACFAFWVSTLFLGPSLITSCGNSSRAEIQDTLTTPEETPGTAAENLLSSTFAQLERNGLPAGWKVSRHGENRQRAKVTAERDRKTGQTVMKIEIPREASVFLDTIHPAELDPKKEYLLLVQLKVEDMHYIGHWYYRPAGIRVEAYGMNNKQRWLAVCGEGGTGGWVTAILPFLTSSDREEAEDLSRPKVLLRCNNMVGTVRFRSPMIVEKPAGVDAAGCFELEDGTQVFGGVWFLTE
jgi:hypothetical protein